MKERSSLFHIKQEDPVPPEAAGRVDLMAQAWIEWGR
jgi:hypothetical protein